MDTSNGDEAAAKPPTPAEAASATPAATDPATTTASATPTPTQETNGEVHADEKPQQPPAAPPVKELTEEEKKALANREKIPNGNIKTAAAAAISAAAVKAKVKQFSLSELLPYQNYYLLKVMKI